MRTIAMTAKHAGKCTQCGHAIVPGNRILWSRGHGAQHADCTTARYQNDQCTVCHGSGRLWNNAPCRQCDGTGSRKVADFARTGGHPARDPMGVDAAYEDDCARRCGL